MAQKMQEKKKSQDLAQGLVKIWAKCLVKIWAKFWVEILVKHDNSNNTIHCNTNGARARSARAPLLFPSPLLFLLFSFTKVLAKS